MDPKVDFHWVRTIGKSIKYEGKTLKKNRRGPEEMALQLRGFASLPEDASLVQAPILSSIQLSITPFPEDLILSTSLCGHIHRTWHVHKHIHINKIF